MTRDYKPPRQPMFWAGLAFSVGLWTGARAWRPPSWWVMAVVVFVLAASYFLRKRAWLAKALSLGVWFLLGALLIEIRGLRRDAVEQDEARISALADGREVTVTGRVMREGYARAAGPKSVRESIDVETEEIASGGESWPVRAGVRLTAAGSQLALHVLRRHRLVELFLVHRKEVKHPDPQMAVSFALMMLTSMLIELILVDRDLKNWQAEIPKDDQSLKRELLRSFLSYLGVEQRAN